MDANTVVIKIGADDWETILDYVYGNIDYDSEEESEGIRAAMNNIRRVYDYEG